jgi:hypothetical protein
VASFSPGLSAGFKPLPSYSNFSPHNIFAVNKSLHRRFMSLYFFAKVYVYIIDRLAEALQ